MTETPDSHHGSVSSSQSQPWRNFEAEGARVLVVNGTYLNQASPGNRNKRETSVQLVYLGM